MKIEDLNKNGKKSKKIKKKKTKSDFTQNKQIKY